MKRIVIIVLISLVIIFGLVPTILVYIGNSYLYDEVATKDPPSENFFKGEKYLRIASKFPGFSASYDKAMRLVMRYRDVFRTCVDYRRRLWAQGQMNQLFDESFNFRYNGATGLNLKYNETYRYLAGNFIDLDRNMVTDSDHDSICNLWKPYLDFSREQGFEFDGTDFCDQKPKQPVLDGSDLPQR